MRVRSEGSAVKAPQYGGPERHRAQIRVAESGGRVAESGGRVAESGARFAESGARFAESGARFAESGVRSFKTKNELKL